MGGTDPKLLIDRIRDGDFSDQDLAELTEAHRDQRIVITDGNRSLAAGGDFNNCYIFTGDHNSLIPLPPAAQQALSERPIEPKVEIHRLPISGRLLIGRAEQLRRLSTAWNNTKTNVISLVAFGGVGKSAVVKHWLAAMEEKGYRGARRTWRS